MIFVFPRGHSRTHVSVNAMSVREDAISKKINLNES